MHLKRNHPFIYQKARSKYDSPPKLQVPPIVLVSTKISQMALHLFYRLHIISLDIDEPPPPPNSAVQEYCTQLCIDGFSLDQRWIGWLEGCPRLVTLQIRLYSDTPSFDGDKGFSRFVWPQQLKNFLLYGSEAWSKMMNIPPTCKPNNADDDFYATYYRVGNIRAC